MASRTVYNLAAVRQLLLAAFTDESLRRFCADRPLLQPVLIQFGSMMGLDDIVDRVMTHCRTHDHWDELLAGVQAENRRQYDRFSDRIRTIDGAALAEAAAPPAEGYSHYFGQALFDLSEMMQDPKVREAVVAFGADFRAARQHASELKERKYLHDMLHDLEFRCYTPISMDAGRFPESDGVVEAFSNYEFFLRQISDDLKEFVDSPRCDAVDTSWIEHIFRAQDSLRGATSNLDARLLKEALRQLRRVLTTQPTRINARLLDAAKALRLSNLVETMRLVNDSLDGLEQEAERLQRFRTGVEALASLERNMTALVQDHNQWQRLDLDLRRIEAVMDLDTEELEWSWPELRSLAETLHRDHDEDWALRFRESIERLEGAITSGNPRLIRLRFREFSREASDRFYRVDRALKRRCEDLNEIGEPLAAVLGMLQ